MAPKPIPLFSDFLSMKKTKPNQVLAPSYSRPDGKGLPSSWTLPILICIRIKAYERVPLT